MNHSTSYESPLAARYASREMSFIFSAQFKFSTWRKLWTALAKCQKTLGIAISDRQIQELQAHVETIDFTLAAEYEKKFRHDVMAHIHAYGLQCPEAKAVIHLGATSCFVTDNTDLIQMREGLHLLKSKLIQVIRQLEIFARRYAHLATLSYTHFQPAQPTTVGKRACLWIQDFLFDLKDLEQKLHSFYFLGLKGATGTQAAFLTLFDGDHEKVKSLDKLVAQEMGFDHLFEVSGQTYPRKQDMRIFSVLTGLAASSHKFASDLRLLAHLKEMEEPFKEEQVGSSAMPHKRNPVLAERICGLSRFLISLNENPSYTAATQWLERTLDDSVNRRLALSEGFLAADALMNLLCSITADMYVHPKILQKNLQNELPFLATETILMRAVKKGGDRQDLHEKLRQLCLASSKKIKDEGAENDLLERISHDPSFHLSQAELQQLIQADHFIGRAPEQTIEFLDADVVPILNRHKDLPSYHPILEI